MVKMKNPFNVCLLQIADALCIFGPVAKVRLGHNKSSYAIVEFVEQEAAKKALSEGKVHLGDVRIICA